MFSTESIFSKYNIRDNNNFTVPKIYLFQKSDKEAKLIPINNEPELHALRLKRRSPLSTEEVAKVNDILIKSSKTLLTVKFNITMTEEKLSCLKPFTWLNDEVINFYMCLLQERDDKLVDLSYGGKKSSHYFNSFFMTKLITKTEEYSYKTVSTWTKNINIFEKDKIFIPLNIKNVHWTMIVVYIQLKEIHYYDSLNWDGQVYLQHLLHWLKDESREKYNNEYIIEGWQLISNEGHVPQQNNSCDCGMFTILCADFVSDNIPFEDSYDQSEILSYRLKVCSRILNGKLTF